MKTIDEIFNKHGDAVEIGDFKESAIEDIKELRLKNINLTTHNIGMRYVRENEKIIEYIKRKFGITEKDLKSKSKAK